MASDAAIDVAVVVEAPLDAALADTRPIRTDATRATRAMRPDADVGSAPPPPVLRSITIGATPWAYFTVDGDPTRYETPATLKLAVGSHRVTFSNPELDVTRTVTVTVPEEGDARHVEKMR